jgi:hypothetical protein
MKKKGEEEQTYFVGKAKGKKGSKMDGSANSPSPTPPPHGSFNIPLSNLSALLSLSIPPPVSNTDLPRVVDDLKTKKAWFEANQARQTAENDTHIEREPTPLDGATTISDGVVDQA